MVGPEAVTAALTEKTVLTAVIHISNVIGMPNPIEEFIQAAHDAGSLVLVDGAQSVPHIPVDDFLDRLGPAKAPG
jgi:cysteine desulfurase/selenocysteine lyase